MHRVMSRTRVSSYVLALSCFMMRSVGVFILAVRSTEYDPVIRYAGQCSATTTGRLWSRTASDTVVLSYCCVVVLFSCRRSTVDCSARLSSLIPPPTASISASLQRPAALLFVQSDPRTSPESGPTQQAQCTRYELGHLTGSAICPLVVGVKRPRVEVKPPFFFFTPDPDRPLLN